MCIHSTGHNLVKDRIHLVLPAEEKERYRAIAEREGTTLSRWIREAVREKANLRSGVSIRSTRRGP